MRALRNRLAQAALLSGVLLVGLVTIAAAQAVAPSPASAPPDWLASSFTVLWNAIGIPGGAAAATIVGGILWRVWDIVKAKAQVAKSEADWQARAGGLEAFAQRARDALGAVIAARHLEQEGAPAPVRVESDDVKKAAKLLHVDFPELDIKAIRQQVKAELGKILLASSSSPAPPSGRYTQTAAPPVVQ